jgi:colicin import membrane protein
MKDLEKQRKRWREQSQRKRDRMSPEKRDAINAKRREKRNDPAVKEEKKAADRLWRLNNPEKIAAQRARARERRHAKAAERLQDPTYQAELAAKAEARAKKEAERAARGIVKVARVKAEPGEDRETLLRRRREARARAAREQRAAARAERERLAAENPQPKKEPVKKKGPPEVRRMGRLAALSRWHGY